MSLTWFCNGGPCDIRANHILHMITGGGYKYTVGFCQRHAELYAAEMVSDFPKRDLCIDCGEKTATFFVQTPYGIAPLCEKHAISLGELMCPSRKPFIVEATCTHEVSNHQFTDILAAVFFADNFMDANSSDDPTSVKILTVDSHGQTLQLYPL